MSEKNLGHILRTARLKKGLSQEDVSKYLKLNSPQSISDWERNYGSGVPLPTLKKLIKLYNLDADKIFAALLDYQQKKLEIQLKTEFYKRK